MAGKRGRVVEQLGEGNEGEVGARRSRMVDNGVENEVHSTSMESAANLFGPSGVPK